MSRWRTSFEQQAFFTNWNAFRAELQSVEVIDKSSETSVLELARMRKVTAYIDAILNGIDPELVPINVLDPLAPHAESSLGQVRAFKGNQNTPHLTKGNAQLDVILSALSPYKPLTSDVSVANAILQSGKDLADYVSQFASKAKDIAATLEATRKDAESVLVDVRTRVDRVQQFERSLFDGEDAIETRVQHAVENCEAKSKEVSALYAEVESAAEKTRTSSGSATANSESIRTLLSNSTTRLDQITEFHVRVFGAGDPPTGGLKSELDERLVQLGEVEKEHLSKHAALVGQIETLLPGATSAGLASSFARMRSDFSKPLLGYTIAFYASLSVLLVVALFAVTKSFSLWPLTLTFVDPPDWDTMGRHLLLKFPLLVPVVWFALFSATRRSQYERLQQEYAHKESLAASYESYKRQLADLKVDVDALQRELIAKTIESVAYNASKTLDGNHAEKLPAMQMLEKFTLEDVKKLLELAKGRT